MVVLVAVGAGLTVILVGLPILVLGILTARGFAYLERQRLGRLTGDARAHPEYLTADPSDGILRRLTTPARDRQSWLDVVWVLVALITATISWAIAVAWWAAAIGGPTYAIWGRTIPRGTDPVTLASLLGFGTSWSADVLVISTIGLVALFTLPLVAARGRRCCTRRWGRTCSAGAPSSSRRYAAPRPVAPPDGPPRPSRCAGSSATSTTARSSGWCGCRWTSAAPAPSSTRTPSWHGRPSTARSRQARETVDELRSLSRGIAPPVLVDRGLEAALREAVARSVVPTTLTYDAPAGLPAHVETAVYFVVAECLTNVAKHSGARSARVSLRGERRPAVVLVEDDGRGGAMHRHPTEAWPGSPSGPGPRTGPLELSSPRGGPTVARTELPCG